ncbi:MAG TPA: hypothetical protein VFX38_07220 [Gammaproteobacteria bacterium]|nr:hypothetical protein [Gammaproteobacteria bacterium]
MASAFLVFSGSNDRAVLAFLRVLERCGERPCIVAWTAGDRVFRSRYRRYVVHTRESNVLDEEHFERCIEAVRRNSGTREFVVLPSSEYLNTFLLNHRGAVEAMGCRVPLVSRETYFQLTDKESAARMFAAGGYCIPAEYVSPRELRFPLVAKPRRNLGSGGRLLYPQFVGSAADFSRFQSRFDAPDFFFQEHVCGESFYLLFHLSRSSKTDVVYSQHNLLQQPGGKSILVAAGANLHETEFGRSTVEFLRKLGFHGLGMIEFIQRDGEMVFIEMNPRIWGPSQLCADDSIPMLESFIGEQLDRDAGRYVSRSRRSSLRRSYVWLGGIMQSLCRARLPVRLGNQPVWPTLIAHGLRDDVYLRRDSWRCFLYDFARAIAGVDNVG